MERASARGVSARRPVPGTEANGVIMTEYPREKEKLEMRPLSLCTCGYPRKEGRHLMLTLLGPRTLIKYTYRRVTSGSIGIRTHIHEHVMEG